MVNTAASLAVARSRPWQKRRPRSKPRGTVLTNWPKRRRADHDKTESVLKRGRDRVKTQTDATGLPRGDSRARLQRKLRNSPRCHGLAPWSFTLVATKKVAQLSQMPRA